jgi:hypothetical protein
MGRSRRWKKQKKNPTKQLMVIADVRSTIHQHSLQRTNANNVIKPSIIMQPLNFTKQDTVKGTNYPLLTKSEGILLVDQMYLPSRISINNGFFSQIKEAEIMSSSQLESSQSEVWNSRFELNKMAMSAVWTDSRTSKVSGISLCIYNQN